MATAVPAPPMTAAPQTLAELLHRLGGVPPARVRVRPPPGTATVADVIGAAAGPDKRLCELVEGVLVEKVMGYPEAILAGLILHYLNAYLIEHDLGIAAGGDGLLRILPDQVRSPDVSVLLWDSLPGKKAPTEPVPGLVPDLAVEVISAGNTPNEMRRKLDDYFAAGVKLVWYVYPKTRTAEAYTSPTAKKKVGVTRSLKGGDLLPGFELPLKKLFERVAKSQNKS